MDLGLKLSLAEEEDEGITVSSLQNHGNSTDYSNELVLIGRVISHRSTNFEALRNMLISLLQPVKGVLRIPESPHSLALGSEHQINHNLEPPSPAATVLHSLPPFGPCSVSDMGRWTSLIVPTDFEG
ncbi:hypothetical protein Salat_2534500 [Sesamum alatum]|uniref:Uncharacterized protein n=1 Tax=Sesamum alatum TaxID=300844 RepID=A0AAE1XS66_9LAMI|nr:hypothetical protein Salat_2534500 [Sesamum alatum]